MSREAVAYVRSRELADPNAARVFMLLAQRTASPTLPDDRPYAMGLELRDEEISALAAQIGVDGEEFRRLLRLLKKMVPMDVLEHPEGVWEIVFGYGYTDPKPQRVTPRDFSAGYPRVAAFRVTGWENYSTWGYEEGLGHFYAQLYRNGDDHNAEPRIWITPPRYVPRTIDELAEAISAEIAPYELVPPPPAVVKLWLQR